LESAESTRRSFRATCRGREEWESNAAAGLFHQRASIPTCVSVPGFHAARRRCCRAPVRPSSSRPLLSIFHMRHLSSRGDASPLRVYLHDLQNCPQCDALPRTMMEGAKCCTDFAKRLVTNQLERSSFVVMGRPTIWVVHLPTDSARAIHHCSR